MNIKSIKIVGPAGFGIKVTGIILAKTLIRQGYHVFAYTEYPSLIRGGHNTYQVDFDQKSANSASDRCDILISLDAPSLDTESKNLRPGGTVLCDTSVDLSKVQSIKYYQKHKIEIIQIPLIDFAKTAGKDLLKNTVALGALMKLIGFELAALKTTLESTFKDKADAVAMNLKAAELGFDEIKTTKYKLPTGKLSSNMLISGNQASSLGIIASGCQIYVAYPMTPASDILHNLESKQRETGMLVHQPEDEIAAIHAALGGAFAGARTATGTSGGGFALMNEGLSLAGMIELPLVIFEVQRPGPATGNPTWTEQGDLSYVLHAGHGEFPRAVIAPGNPEETFTTTQHAFNLADIYQIPVIILTDKFLGESSYTVPQKAFDKILPHDRGKTILSNQELKNLKQDLNYKRYLVTKDGISYRTIPTVCSGEHGVTGVEHREDGVRCEHVVNSDEHNQLSYSDEESEVRIRMANKRMQKLGSLKKKIPLPKIYGPKDAKISLVAWGSMWGPCLDAVNQHNNQPKVKSKVNLIHFSYLWPLPNNLDKFLKKFKKLILVENNYQGQFGKLLRQETGINIERKLLKYDSRPFWPEEIIDQISK